MHVEKIFAPSDEAIRRAAAFLSSGELVGVPTETVYGLAANALDPTAIAKVFSAKGRPSTNPLIIHLASIDSLPLVTFQPLPSAIQQQVDALSDLWPGPLTLVLPRSSLVSDLVSAGRKTVAVRVPAHEVTQRLLRECGFPLAAPSANRSTYVSPTTAAHVAEGLGEHVAMILDGGPCGCGLESTIVLLEGRSATILRPGVITREELSHRLQTKVDVYRTTESKTAMLAPGMMREHYAPRTPLRLITQILPEQLSERCGRIAFGPISPEERSPYQYTEILSPTRDLNEVAKKLFAAIRDFDGRGLELIVVDVCESQGIGQAIMDRLLRAAAR